MVLHRSLLLWVAGILAAATVARADLIQFKDGFSLEGKVKQQGGWQQDIYSDQPVWMPRGIYVLDAGARRIYFSHSQIQDVDNRDLNRDTEFIQLETHVSRMNHLPMYPLVQIVGATEFDNRWERDFKINAESVGPNPRLHIRQRVSVLTPQFARVEALKYNWTSYYQTRELGYQAVRNLLASHPDLALKKDAKDAERRFRVFRFLTQAGWLDEAGKELEGIRKDFPDDKDKIDEAALSLRKIVLLRVVEDIERANKASRHEWAQKRLAELPTGELSDKLASDMRSLRTNYQAKATNLEQARTLLKELAGALPDGSPKFLADAAGTIRAELVPESLERLEVFLEMARQAKRDQDNGKRAANDPGQLLALAITGWLQGKEAAENNAETAQKLWKGRQFVLDYMKTETDYDRGVALKAYEAQKTERLRVDEISQMIRFLPPVAPEADISSEPKELQTNLPDSRSKKPISYWVRLPAEYTHSRPYPVLFALHLGGEKARVMIDRLGNWTAAYGYILVSPEWAEPLENVYHYTPQEHAAVLDVLRDVRRRFQIDSDRVFLSGFGQGGNMAYDVGLAHPDLFAGVVLMSAMPLRFPTRYWHNCQNLPLFLVDGELAGNDGRANRPLLEKWILKGYPVVYVEYKGRGIEWYEWELPTIFDWMDHKRGLWKRASGLPELGKLGSGGSNGEEYQTLREIDNRFYWLTTDSIAERHLLETGRFNNQVAPATLQGRISEGNQININVRGLHEVTVWLGQGMIDFTKPVTVRINGGLMMANRKVTPSLSTLLEDFFQRGDRQRLFWAKLEFDRLQ
jgi:enterochelin esterase-like enzyme